MSRILVVSHEASLTGAPRVAVDILRATAGQVDERLAVVRWPGPLVGDFASAADRVRLEPLRRVRVGLRRFGPTRRVAVKVEQAAARAVIRDEQPDLVYLNTVLSACYVRPALESGCRVVLHSHEMDDLASGTLARYGLRDLYRDIRLVACSAAAATRLREITGVETVGVICSVADIDRVRDLAGETPVSEPARPQVVACGTADPRKGTDLWLEVARRTSSLTGGNCPDFVWVGHDSDGRYEALSRDMGLGSLVRFVGPTRNPYPTMAMSDVVTVPSRQDASPLVVLEAMALGKPVVAFDVGGIRDQLGDAGVLVPPGDVEAMADAVATLLADPQARGRLGGAGEARVRDLFSFDTFRRQVRGLVSEELARG